jgi:hypothetical protein
MDLVFNSERFIKNPHGKEMAGACDRKGKEQTKRWKFVSVKFENDETGKFSGMSTAPWLRESH